LLAPTGAKLWRYEEALERRGIHNGRWPDLVFEDEAWVRFWTLILGIRNVRPSLEADEAHGPEIH